MAAKRGKTKIRIQDLKPKNDVNGGRLPPGLPTGNPPSHNPPTGHGPRPNLFHGP